MTERGNGGDLDIGAAPRPRVLYVMGAGRSGSTILGVTLGNCAGVFYAGELDAWLARAGEPQLQGEERERFWESVRARVDGASELFGREPELAIERSASLFRVHKWRARRRMRDAYRRVAEGLYRAVSEASGATFLVDSSHYPLRARELQALAGIDLYILYLLRDPRSVVASFARKDIAQYSKSRPQANVYLWLTNLLSVLVFLRQPAERRLFVSYEDFVADPAAVIGDILRRAGAPVVLPDFSAMRTGIPFQGNRLIRTDSLALEQRPPAPPRRAPVTTLLQLPWRPVLRSLRPRTSSSAARASARGGKARALAQ